jgi:hypothetical protein
MDAIAAPFVQGQLINEPLQCQIQTTCAHSGRPIHIEIDSELNYSVREEGARPLVFSPMVDFEKLEAPSIIDAF